MAKKRKTHSSTCEACSHQIDFYYDTDNIPKLDMTEVATLNEAAEDRANEMVKDGYMSGELCCVITRPSGREYEVRGWWSIHKEPVTMDVILNFEGMEPQYYRVFDKDNETSSPSASDFRKACEAIASKYWRSKKRNEMSMIEYFEVEIDKAGWDARGLTVNRIDMK